MKSSFITVSNLNSNPCSAVFHHSRCGYFSWKRTGPVDELMVNTIPFAPRTDRLKTTQKLMIPIPIYLPFNSKSLCNFHRIQHHCREKVGKLRSKAQNQHHVDFRPTHKSQQHRPCKRCAYICLYCLNCLDLVILKPQEEGSYSSISQVLQPTYASPSGWARYVLASAWNKSPEIFKGVFIPHILGSSVTLSLFLDSKTHVLSPLIAMLLSYLWISFTLFLIFCWYSHTVTLFLRIKMFLIPLNFCIFLVDEVWCIRTQL